MPVSGLVNSPAGLPHSWTSSCPTPRVRHPTLYVFVSFTYLHPCLLPILCFLRLAAVVCFCLLVSYFVYPPAQTMFLMLVECCKECSLVVPLTRLYVFIIFGFILYYKGHPFTLCPALVVPVVASDASNKLQLFVYVQVHFLKIQIDLVIYENNNKCECLLFSKF